MKRLLMKLGAVPTAIAMTLAIAATAFAQPVQTPLRSPVVVNGTTGGPQSGSCGFVPRTPSQVVQVTEAFTSLRFKVQSSGQTTLLITGPGGRSQCVMSPQGNIDVPGVWERGTYSLFVGERAQNAANAYTLSISQE